MTTGERIRTIRLAKGMTQKEVTNRCGMPDSSIRKYESGQFIPTPKTFRRLADAMDASITDFFDFSIEETADIIDIEYRLVLCPPHKRHIYEEKLDKYINAGILRMKTEKLQLQTETVTIKNTQISDRNFQRITNCYNRLNEKGQMALLQHIQELIQIPAYTETK